MSLEEVMSKLEVAMDLVTEIRDHPDGLEVSHEEVDEIHLRLTFMLGRYQAEAYRRLKKAPAPKRSK